MASFSSREGCAACRGDMARAPGAAPSQMVHQFLYHKSAHQRLMLLLLALRIAQQRRTLITRCARNNADVPFHSMLGRVCSSLSISNSTFLSCATTLARVGQRRGSRAAPRGAASLARQNKLNNGIAAHMNIILSIFTRAARLGRRHSRGPASTYGVAYTSWIHRW